MHCVLTYKVNKKIDTYDGYFRLNLDNWDFEHPKSCRYMFSLRQVSALGCNARTVSIIAKVLAVAGLQEQVSLEYDLI